MGENSEEPESRPAKQASQKTKAEDNPWYLLATLYGVPEPRRTQWLRDSKNWLAWNWYFAANLDEETREGLD